MYWIYLLEDPRTAEIRYVGRTKKFLQERLHDHLNARSRNRADHKGSWLRNLYRLGLRPSIHPIQKLSSFEDSCGAERYWIGFFRAQGSRLVNLANGGEGAGSFKHRPESISKMKAAGIGKWTRSLKDIEANARRNGARAIVDGLGRVYPTLGDAARGLNLHRGGIRKVLQGQFTQTGGHTFRYQEG